MRVSRLSALGVLTAGGLLIVADQQRTPASGFYAGVPLTERSHAYGASDPSWSPDGTRVLFSLFGSLWTVGMGGGVASQVTHGTGYDAGAAWSPGGRVAAFLRGTGPLRGVQLGTQGKLTVVDMTTGSEIVLAPDMQFIGTPSWSRNGTSLYVNSVLGQEYAIYEVPLDGKPRRVTGMLYSRVSTIVQRGGGWFHTWYPLAVHPSGQEIVFGGDRDSTPQLWRMPVTDGLVVTRKLTSYAERDQADIQDVAWLDSSTALYSANLHSKETNFDLWRWNGKAVPVTRTIYDEFSPRASPDGKTVLFVSNYLGNPDLFLTSASFEAARHLRIDELRFHKGTAKLRVRVQDEEGNIVPARVSVRGSDRKYYAPAGALIRLHPGMGDSAGFFHSSGEFVLEGPAGQFRVAAFRGIEYESAVSESATGDITLTLRRRFAWQGNGWWSGEDHIHANYAGPYYLRPPDALLMAQAEDLNVSNLLVANAEGAREYDREFFEGRPSNLSTSTQILYWNQEFRNRIVYGHMALLNLKSLIAPGYTSFEGTPNPYDYPSNTMVAEETRRKGGTVAYVHPIVGSTRDPFDFTVSAKELPVTAALGLVDVVDIYPWGPVAAEIWHALLNCGFRIAPGAGTDTFANWRSINQVPGNSRILVQSTAPLSYSTWIGGMRAGRSFVTNGPLLRVSVNGAAPGAVVTSPSGARLDLHVKVRVESTVALETVEVLINGAVVHKVEARGARELDVIWKKKDVASGWLAVRVQGATDPRALGAVAQAHSSPVYLEAQGQPMRPLPDAARMFITWIDRLSDLMESRNNFQSSRQKEEVRSLIRKARAFYARWTGPK